MISTYSSPPQVLGYPHQLRSRRPYTDKKGYLLRTTSRRRTTTPCFPLLSGRADAAVDTSLGERDPFAARYSLIAFSEFSNTAYSGESWRGPPGAFALAGLPALTNMGIRLRASNATENRARDILACFTWKRRETTQWHAHFFAHLLCRGEER
jgi:hypothetical protein